MALRERIQNPPPSEFKMEDLVWTNHVIHGKSRHKASKLIVIPWDMLVNFIYGKQHPPFYPCKFNHGVIRQNLPNSLRSPCAHNPALVVRFDPLPSHLSLWVTSGIVSLPFLMQIDSKHLLLSFPVIGICFMFILLSFYVIQALESAIHSLLMVLANIVVILVWRTRPRLCPQDMQALLKSTQQ